MAGSPRARAPWALALLLPLLALTTLAPPGRAQVHPTLEPLPARGLHRRLALADAVAIGRIESVATGRLQVDSVRAVVGAPPGRFAVKRAPSSPPPVKAGQRAVLLLRGARPPYVLADRPDELILPPDAAAEERWAGALAELHAALAEPHQIPAVYGRWLAGDFEPLRVAAAIALGDPEAPFDVPAELARELARLAAGDPSPALRRAAATAAARSDAGRAELLTLLPGEAADSRVLLIGLRAAAQASPDQVVPLLLRALAVNDVGVRRAAARAAAGLRDPALRAELERLAQQDPDDGVRASATRALHRRR